MPETLTSLLQIDGLVWLFTAVFIAGLVRGFAGFGSGMIIMPAASSIGTKRGRRCVPPAPGKSPRLTSGKPNWPESAATR